MFRNGLSTASLLSWHVSSRSEEGIHLRIMRDTLSSIPKTFYVLNFRVAA